MDMDRVETLSNNTQKLLTNTLNPDLNPSINLNPSLNKSPSSSILFYIGIVLLLIVLGFFIFKYLGDISTAINNFVAKILGYCLYATARGVAHPSIFNSTNTVPGVALIVGKHQCAAGP